MIACSVVVLLSLSVPATPPSGQPWRIDVDRSVDAAHREKEAGKDAEKRLAVAQYCLDRGLFSRAAELLAGLAGEAPDEAVHGEAAALFGLAASDGGLARAEATRFSKQPPAATEFIALPTNSRRAEILRERHREMKLANKSTYFDLWTDLDPESLVPYTKTLNDYYREFRNRFRADFTNNIDVRLFRNRSDYLIDYVRRFGTSGENVLGYYQLSTRQLVFYDDPHEKDEVLLTAKHECTHLLIDLSYGGAAIPPWLHEGLACFLAGDGLEARGGPTLDLALKLMDMLDANTQMTIGQLMKVDAKGLEYAHYAWAWSLVYFFNRDDRADAFRSFLTTLRDAMKDAGDATPVETRDRVVSVFESVFGAGLAQLDDAWRSYFREEFRLERDDQLVDAGFGALDRALYLDSERDRRRALEVAEAAFEMVSPAGRDARHRLGEVSCWVRRAGVSEDLDLDGLRLMLRRVLGALPALASLDGSERGRLVRRTLEVLAYRTGNGRTAAGAIDLRERLVAQADAAAGAEQDVRRALVVLFDELAAAGFQALGAVLSRDPVHRAAIEEWIHLAMEFAPGRLDEVFPLARLRVELDPDDRAMAALGAVYVGLGRDKWGKVLMKDAESRSARPGSLARFKSYAGA